MTSVDGMLPAIWKLSVWNVSVWKAPVARMTEWKMPVGRPVITVAENSVSHGRGWRNPPRTRTLAEDHRASGGIL